MQLLCIELGAKRQIEMEEGLSYWWICFPNSFHLVLLSVIGGVKGYKEIFLGTEHDSNSVRYAVW